MDHLISLMLRVSELSREYSNHDTNEFMEGIRLGHITSQREELLKEIHELKKQLQIPPEKWSALCKSCYLAHN